MGAILIVAVVVGGYASLNPSPADQGQNTGNRAQIAADEARIVMHIHPRLEIVVEGIHVPLQPNIGIAEIIWKDHTLDRYGMRGMSPLHTHDPSGTIHVESTVRRPYTLGEFFDVWGVHFNASCIFDWCGAGRLTMWVNGVPSTEFQDHVLRDGELIRIEFHSASDQGR